MRAFVTGASGGLGTIAIDLLTAAGYEVHAITGKVEQFDWLARLGARQCISRHDLHWGHRPLEKARWAGAFDNVGGDMLSGITRVINYYGNIASCGLAGGHDLQTTVMPFILRNVSLRGVDSVMCPVERRKLAWQRLVTDLPATALATLNLVESGGPFPDPDDGSAYADLDGALLVNVILAGADLTGASIEGADFTNAQTCGATMPDGSAGPC